MLLESVKKSRYICNKLGSHLSHISPPASSSYFPILQDSIFRIVASILHLGNVTFAKGEEIDSSVLEDEKSKFHLQTAAELLMYECDIYT